MLGTGLISNRSTMFVVYQTATSYTSTTQKIKGKFFLIAIMQHARQSSFTAHSHVFTELQWNGNSSPQMARSCPPVNSGPWWVRTGSIWAELRGGDELNMARPLNGADGAHTDSYST